MDLPKGVEGLKELTRTGPKSKAVRIWEKKKEDLLADLDASIEQAKGRYVDNNRASPTNPVALTEDGKAAVDKDGKPILLDRVAAAPNWRVQMNAKTKSNPNPSVVLVDDAQKGQEYPDEAVFVYLKAGRTKVPLWADADGNRRTERRISSADLVAVLEYLKSQVEGWTPDSEDGRIFHQVGVIDAIAPAVRSRMAAGEAFAHCAEADKIVEKAEVKKASAFALDTVIKPVMSVSGGLLSE